MALPPRPDPLFFWDVAQVFVDVEVRPTGTGGGSIHEYQVGYGLSERIHQNTVSSTDDPVMIVGGLQPHTKYYFWSRVRNADGWSPWSARNSATTRAGAMIKHNGIWRKAIPYVRSNGVWRVAQPYIKYRGYWEEADS